MFTKRLPYYFAAFGLILVTVLLFSSTGSGPFCPRRVAADDNPCLAQEATIGALKGALLQSTLDTQNYRATIAALSSGNGVPSTAGDKSTQKVYFTESFENNDNGWDLTSDKYSARLSQGRLRITTTGSDAILVVPNVNVVDFYVDMDVEYVNNTCGSGALLGFAVGDFANKGNFNRMELLECNRAAMSRFDAFKWQKRLTDTRYDNVYDHLNKAGWKFKMGFQSKKGLYTLYIDDIELDTVSFVPQGAQLALVAYRDYGGSEFSLDNINVRDSR